jgi:predicted membrane channel-forming protein YqfA (hemolysin III family)
MERNMKSIWYFVGLMLLAMGAVIFLSGIYFYFFPNETTTKLQELHPSIWWGAVMIIAGFIFFFGSLKSASKQGTK